MDLQTLIPNLITLLNTVVAPLLLSIAFLLFLWNMTRYFIIGGANEKEHEQAKSVALYGLAAFFVMFSIWGIVNLFVGGFGFTSNTAVAPDYLKTGGSTRGPDVSGQNFPYANDDAIGDPCSIENGGCFDP